jgi:hypothetical protein
VTYKIFGVKIDTTEEKWNEFVAWSNDINKRLSEPNADGSFKGGAIGGNFTLELTPTGLGMIYVVKDSYTKTEIDLTDFGSW